MHLYHKVHRNQLNKVTTHVINNSSCDNNNYFSSPLQIVQLINELLMLLLRILHGIVPLHVLLRLLVNVVQLLVANESVLRRHLKDDGHLGVGQDLNVLVAGEVGAEGQLGRVLYRGGGSGGSGGGRGAVGVDVGF